MRQIVINKSLFEDVLRINSQCDTFCSIINCTLVKLHEGAELYACLRADGGEPCKLYIADCAETVAKSISPNENECSFITVSNDLVSPINFFFILWI